MKKKQSVSKVLTLSKYDWGQHHFDDHGRGRPSFAESLTPLNGMIEDLYNLGVPLGSKIEVTMKVKPSKKK